MVHIGGVEANALKQALRETVSCESILRKNYVRKQKEQNEEF